MLNIYPVPIRFSQGNGPKGTWRQTIANAITNPQRRPADDNIAEVVKETKNSKGEVIGRVVKLKNPMRGR